MPWREFTVDNNRDTKGNGRRRDKAYIIIYQGKELTFRITARHHDGHFKWYLDCETGGVYEEWFAVVPIETTKSVKMRAINLLLGNTKVARSMYGTVDLRTAEQELLQKRA